jgi:hypothetical protein
VVVLLVAAVDLTAPAVSARKADPYRAAAEPPMAAMDWPSASVDAQAVHEIAQARLNADLAAVQAYRPEYPFWQHLFTISDGHIIFGSAEDGRLIATFPSGGNWQRDGVWEEPELAGTLDGVRLPSNLNRRRDTVAELLESKVGPVVHNPTRGQFLSPNIDPYGPFLSEWSAIYERFGVPAQIGLAQAVIESGLDGRARSRAQALGLCQWLRRNWEALDRLAPSELEAYNQTTQAPYCAAYLSVLATMYGSFIPALSEHQAGGANVGRAIINGERLGGADTREAYLLGSEFARGLRDISIRRYRDLFRTFGPQSFLYTEMVFGTTLTVRQLATDTPQEQIFAMRVPRAIPLADITRRMGLPAAEIKRFNPALVREVPRDAYLYLPSYVSAYGPDVSFWHHPASPAFAAVLNEFVHLDASVEEWHEATFESTLRDFQERFTATGTEEGTVMATTLAYVIGDLRTSRRATILEEFRTSDHVLALFRQGVEALGPLVPTRRH